MTQELPRSKVKLSRSEFLAFSPPLLGEEEIAEVIDTLRSDWITTGPKVRRFEEEFAAFVGAPAALALSSCMAAMHVALAAPGIGPGDAIITTPIEGRGRKGKSGKVAAVDSGRRSAVSGREQWTAMIVDHKTGEDRQHFPLWGIM